MNTNEDGARCGEEYEQKRDPDAEEDEEMALKEKDLADDAPWKKIQKNTFTRWCNEHLKCVNKHIADLDTDLSDGIRLIALLQVLSQKRVPKHNPKPTFRSQKLENVSVSMKFIEDQNIKIVNIGTSCSTFSQCFFPQSDSKREFDFRSQTGFSECFFPQHLMYK